MNDDSGTVTHKQAVDIAMSGYVGVECPYCNKEMSRQDLDDSVWAGEAPAHRACWDAIPLAARNLMVEQHKEIMELRDLNRELSQTNRRTK